MSVFFNYNNSICAQGQSKCLYSFDPSISSLKELLLYELKQIVYYIIKLDELSIDTKEIRDKVIYNISFSTMNLDFRREELHKIIKKIRDEKKEIEDKYLELCKQQNIPSQPLKPSYDLTPGKSEIIKDINEGERQALLKNTILSKTKKDLYEIMINLIQACCLFLSETDNFDFDQIEGKKAVIRLLNATNFPSMPDEKWISKINEFSKINLNVMKKLTELMANTSLPIEEKIVDLSIKKGPAILVSGHFIKDLIELLNETANENINIYTHNGMILAHSHKLINNYPNLAGHYQFPDNTLSTTSEVFPGPILMSKNSQSNIHLIRGRIFTMDKHPLYGLSHIENYDFSELIKVAKESKGFEKDIELGKIKVGFNREKILNKLQEIISKIKSGEISHLFIIDLMKQYPHKNDYIEEFFKLIPDDNFAISLSYDGNKKNIWHIDSYYGYSVIYLVLSELSKNFDIEKLNLTMIFTQCNVLTASFILNFKSMGIHSIYLGNCCPLTVNPSVVEGLCNLFDVKYTTDNPSKDFEDILQKVQ